MLLALIGGGMTANAPSAEAASVGRPTNVKVYYTKKQIVVTWNKAKNAKFYQVWVTKQGYYGPYNAYTTKNTHKAINKSVLPYRNTKGYLRVEVVAKNGKSSSAVVKTSKVQIKGKKVSTKHKKAAARKAKSCLNQGMTAAVVVTGSGVLYTGVTYFVPGLNVVTFGGVMAGAGTTGAATYVACLVAR
ncbi:hypothetical protein [Isoptericola sp. NPDC057191]|uniref:hypothetical protein n=1 Tax=Isoptericola sp. NPDC057191 TaxID=3346041 RepID=UPI00363EEE9B